MTRKLKPAHSDDQHVKLAFGVAYIGALMGAWIALLTPASVTLAVRVGQLAPDTKSAALALVASAGAGAALIANPVFGVLSDRSRSRFGRRWPFILGGSVVGCSGAALLGFAPSIPLLAIGWVLVQFAFNAAIAGLVAILPERIPPHLRGRLSGFMGMAPQVGVVVGTFLISRTGTTGYAPFALPALIGFLAFLPFLLLVRDPPLRSGLDGRSIWQALGSVWINPFAHRDFALAWLGRFLVWIALYELTTYKTFFLIDRLGYTTDNVASVLTRAMFLLAVCIAAVSIPSGWLSDRLDRRKPFVVLASVLYAAAVALVAFATTVEGFLLAVALSGMAMGMYLGVDYALVAAVLPNAAEEAGKGMGVFNLSSTIPQTAAPVVAPLFLSIGAQHGHGNYTALYLICATLALAGAVITLFIRTK